MIERICWILLLNIIFFYRTTKYQYVSDDIDVSQRKHPENKIIRRIYQISGAIRIKPDEDHLLTTIFHSLVAVGIYIGFGSNDISFLASILFSFNPTNNQGSVWISGRPYVLSTIGMVWALALPIISPLFILLAAYFNAGFISPLALLGSPVPFAVVSLPIIWWFHYGRFKDRVKEKMSQEMLAFDKEVSYRKLIVGIKTFAYYALLIIIPHTTAFYHSFMQSLSGSGLKKGTSLDKYFYLGLILISTIIWYWATHKWDTISFCLLWYCIGIAPFTNIVRMNQECSERYCYLPSVGIMVILSTLIISYPILIGVFIAAYVTKLWFYMEAYKDDYFLVEYSRINDQDAWFAWHVAGHIRWRNSSVREAIILWVMAKMKSPNEFKVLFNLATALRMMQNFKESDQFLQMAMDNVPKGQEENANRLRNELTKEGKLPTLI